MKFALPGLGQSLYHRFILWVCMLMLLVFTIAVATAAWINTRGEMIRQAEERAKTMEIYLKALAQPLWDCDETTSEGIVNALALDPRVTEVQLRDICRQRDITVGNGTPEEDSEFYRENVRYRDASGRDYEVGTLSVRFLKTSFTEVLSARFWDNLEILPLMLFGVLIGTVLIFRRLVGEPLAWFRAVITSRSGSCGPCAAAYGRNDELGDVMRAYDGLLDKLEVRYRRQELLAQCAHDLITTTSGGETASLLNGLLDQITQVVNREHIALMMANVDDPVGSNSLLVAYGGLPCPEVKEFARWREQMNAREAIVGRLDDVPKAEREALESVAVFGIALMPVWGLSQWHGYLRIFDMGRTRRWESDELSFVQTVADMIGALLENKLKIEELAKANSKLHDNEEVLMHMARCDALTGLGNRLMLEEELARVLLHAERTGQPGTVLMIDLNGFKEINDTYGHECGDLVLQQTAKRLRAAVCQSDTVVRLGGDEFVIVTELAPNDAKEMCDTLRCEIQRPLVLADREIRMGASIGYACFPLDGVTSTELLACADRAMYSEKRSLRSGDAE